MYWQVNLTSRCIAQFTDGSKGLMFWLTSPPRSSYIQKRFHILFVVE